MIPLLIILLILLFIALGFFTLLRILGEPKDEVFIDYYTYTCKPNIKKWLNVLFKALHFIFIKVTLKIAYSLPTFEFIWKSKEDSCKGVKNG